MNHSFAFNYTPLHFAVEARGSYILGKDMGEIQHRFSEVIFCLSGWKCHLICFTSYTIGEAMVTINLLASVVISSQSDPVCTSFYCSRPPVSAYMA